MEPSVAFATRVEHTESNPNGRDREPPCPAAARISPLATALALAAVGFAVVVGVTGPRLRDRHGTAQQDTPVGDLAVIAAMHEERAALDAVGGRSRDSALARLPDLAEQTVGRRGAPDLAAAGWHAEDARNVELAPGLLGTMVLYADEDGDGTLSVVMLPDLGQVIRHDGFGRAMPLAPGDEWMESVTEDGTRRIAYALADGRVLWLVLAERRSAIGAVARLLR